MRIPSIPTSSGAAWTAANTMLTDIATPTLRLGVTGLSRAGKTVLITALVRSLVSGGRLPFLTADADRRIANATLEPQPNDRVPRFDYETHLEMLARTPPDWPSSTRRISELRLSIAYRPEAGLRRWLGVRRLNLDIVDYPGEWLTDLAMLGQDYASWSAEALALAREPRRTAAARTWLEFLGRHDGLAREDEQLAREGSDLFKIYLAAQRDRDAVSTLGPGRFLMPGDLEGSPLLTFFPLDLPQGADLPRGSLAAMMARRYDSYRKHVVRPFFRDHFSSLDRQIVLVDVLAALNGGPAAVTDLQRAIAGALSAFRPGRNTWLTSLLAKRVDRILFAATKADHLHHANHDRLEAILRLMTDRAIVRAEAAGAGVKVMALSALRSTREAEARVGSDLLPCIVGVPMPGERIGDKVFDGMEEAAIFPGDLPADPATAVDAAEAPAPGNAAFVRFRPIRVALPGADGESPPAPHIRLDRALEFLIGDWLA